MLEVIEEDKNKEFIVIKIKEIECPRCKSKEVKNNKKYFKIVGTEKLNLKTTTKVILLNFQKNVKNAIKHFLRIR